MYTDAINGMSNIPIINAQQATKVTPETDAKSFEQFYSAALDLVNETNSFQQQAEQAQIDFVTGKNDDMLGVLLAQEKAYASINFTLQVTNKMVEAYREIMRIQI